MREILEANGWWMYHSCTCGGSRKEKFKHPNKPGIEMHIRPTKAKWFYLKGNKRVFDEGVGLITLKAKLLEI